MAFINYEKAMKVDHFAFVLVLPVEFFKKKNREILLQILESLI